MTPPPPPPAARAVVALAGNPNTGKTTLFNRLTGARQHVGNWPGVTIERRSGRCRRGDVELEVVDLPGAYSLVPASVDEQVARDALLDGGLDAVVVVVDATNLERNLYLVAQLLELAPPVVVALNQVDLARSRGLWLDADRLAGRLGVPVVPTVARSGAGVDDLLDVVVGIVTRSHRVAG